jgi:flavin reductase
MKCRVRQAGRIVLPRGILECVIDTKVAAGTHSIFIGRVVAIEESDRLPLMYRNGKVLWPERTSGR